MITDGAVRTGIGEQSSSTAARIAASSGRFAGSPAGRSWVARRGIGFIGRAVVDAEGVELGFVAAEEGQFLIVEQGPVGRLRLGRRYVGQMDDRIVLRGPAAEIFAGLNVVDTNGEFVGIIRDTIEAEDVLDSFVVEDERGEMVTVLLEDVRAIDEWMELDIAGDDLYEEG